MSSAARRASAVLVVVACGCANDAPVASDGAALADASVVDLDAGAPVDAALPSSDAADASVDEASPDLARAAPDLPSPLDALAFLSSSTPSRTVADFVQRLVLRDFDGDGKLDVLSGGDSDGLFVQLGHGDGSFGPALALPRTYASDSSVVAVGDFDGDGVPDVASRDQTHAFGLGVFLGRGDGSFVSAGPAAPGFDFDVIAVDLNGDGRTDVIRLLADPAVKVMLAGPGGALVDHATYALPSVQAGPVVLALGDVDGDGRLDVVTGRGDVLLGEDGGDFALLPQSAQLGATDLALADLDGDGRADAIEELPGVKGLDVVVRRGVGDGTFLAAQVLLPALAAARVHGMVVADLDGDGHVDCAVPDVSGSIEVLRGLGAAQFAAPVAYAAGLGALAAGDLDGDGIPDLLAPASDPVHFRFLRGRGGARFFAAPSSPLVAIAVAAGDFDEDGALDVLAVDAVGNSAAPMSVHHGNGDGTFGGAGTAVEEQFWARSGVAVADFDGDGHLDFAVGNPVSNTVDYWFGAGDGTFPRSATVAVAAAAYGDAPRAGPVAADLDGDGGADVALVMQFGAVYVVWDGKGPADSLGTGSGGIAVGDFDGDGILDVVSGRTALRGLGNRAFATAQLAGDVGAPATVGDFDGDGRSDVALAEAGQLCFAYGDPGALLGAVTCTTMPAQPTLAADFNLDGKTDLVVGNGVIVLGRGDRMPAPSYRYDGTLTVTVGDLDGDGKPDILEDDPVAAVLNLSR